MSNSSIQGALPAPARPIRAGNPDFARRAAAPLLRVGRVIWDFVIAVGDVPNELSRMADQFQATRPETAARLRSAARKGWGW